MTTLAIGTEKGGYLLDGGDGLGAVEGPLFPGWMVTAWGTTPGGARLAALGSNWFGASIHRSEDGRTWEQVPEGPAFVEGGPKLEQIWELRNDGARILAGVAQAGLFTSDDDGRSWAPVGALNDHAARDGWMPGAGGLAAHHVLTGAGKTWVGISAVGVMRSDDGLASFLSRDKGISWTVDPETEGVSAEGYCVHGLAQDPDDPMRIWRQDHSGVYRTTDGGDQWERIEEGLPSRFGFPMLRDHASGRLFVVPLTSDENRVPKEGRFAVYRSDDDGDSWQVSGTGWPEVPTFTTVLRKAMDADGEGRIAAGTTGGEVWVSDDAGDSWRRFPFRFPRILAVRWL